MKPVHISLDKFKRIAGTNIGLLTNASWLTQDFSSAMDWLKGSLHMGPTKLFAPEHGLYGAAGPGEKVADAVDPKTGLPVISLYGPRSAPELLNLKDLSVLVVALPDLGVRAFTYLATTLGAVSAAAEAGVEILILDRPSPLGSPVEGSGVQEGATSFVAPYDLPLRHGLSLGQAARLFAFEQGLPLPSLLEAASPPVWVAPSPNLPTLASALAYSGTVLLEGTNLSEGRGTTRPFSLIGAPWVDGFELACHLEARRYPGFRVRPAFFYPTSSKYAGQLCSGVELFITDASSYSALTLVLEVLAFARRYPAFSSNGALERLWGGRQLGDWLNQNDPDPQEVLLGIQPYQAEFLERVSAMESR